MQATQTPPTSVATKPVLTAEMRKAIEAFYPRYPSRRAVVLPALHVVNETLGYVPLPAVIEIAEMLGLAPAQCKTRSAFITSSRKTNRSESTGYGSAAR